MPIFRFFSTTFGKLVFSIKLIVILRTVIWQGTETLGIKTPYQSEFAATSWAGGILMVMKQQMVMYNVEEYNLTYFRPNEVNCRDGRGCGCVF